jgi:hypothetical protein
LFLEKPSAYRNSGEKALIFIFAKLFGRYPVQRARRGGQKRPEHIGHLASLREATAVASERQIEKSTLSGSTSFLAPLGYI